MIHTTTINRVTTQTLKTRTQLENETGKTLTQNDYQNIKTATTSILRVYGFTWDNIPIKTTGPNHMGLTRILSWQKKGSKHFYRFLRAKINRGALTSPS